MSHVVIRRNHVKTAFSTRNSFGRNWHAFPLKRVMTGGVTDLVNFDSRANVLNEFREGRVVSGVQDFRKDGQHTLFYRRLQ